ncbi:uncharacterized protein LOC119662710 isoform X2 [Teleopsis dalmanni]|uniref:uncharacterized protein LOC119662710 isoform X2 n=1 Tax=Teleopsis dalmanni TaxID=139649 RepID=UPI0018CFA064|nr:uncharacterized protein LOC119662710 isoform X2 [Teleopsis dalmanni]
MSSGQPKGKMEGSTKKTASKKEGSLLEIEARVNSVTSNTDAIISSMSLVPSKSAVVSLRPYNSLSKSISCCSLNGSNFDDHVSLSQHSSDPIDNFDDEDSAFFSAYNLDLEEDIDDMTISPEIRERIIQERNTINKFVAALRKIRKITTD